MSKNVLFIHGAGDGGYKEDELLAASLRKELGPAYKVHFPIMSQEETESFFGSDWPKQIGEKISAIKGEVILVGHSLGASMLLKYLTEMTKISKTRIGRTRIGRTRIDKIDKIDKISENISGVFLAATPFWSGDEDWVQPLKLREGFQNTLPKDVPIFFYQCKDDEEVPLSHFNRYKRIVQWATFREIKSGGHQFNNDLSIMATDIKSL
jgi:predicted alpha/beta hydrolase family esterase